jgi:hypothetical protein
MMKKYLGLLLLLVTSSAFADSTDIKYGDPVYIKSCFGQTNGEYAGFSFEGASSYILRAFAGRVPTSVFYIRAYDSKLGRVAGDGDDKTLKYKNGEQVKFGDYIYFSAVHDPYQYIALGNQIYFAELVKNCPLYTISPIAAVFMLGGWEGGKTDLKSGLSCCLINIKREYREGVTYDFSLMFRNSLLGAHLYQDLARDAHEKNHIAIEKGRKQ